MPDVVTDEVRMPGEAERGDGPICTTGLPVGLQKTKGEGFMTAKVKAIPEGCHSVTPYLIIDGAADAIEFYKKAFGAKEIYRMPMPDGRLGHAEVQIGDSRVMMADENQDMDIRSPKTFGGTPLSLMIYVEDADKVFQQALGAGARVLKPLKDQFYGDRSGNLEDPFGHKWTVSTHVEDVPPEEMEKRMKESMEAEAVLD